MGTRAGSMAKATDDDGTAAEPTRMQEVLDVAGRLFNEKGYRSTSLADIGEVLGMNKASLYYYVGSKEELVRKLILRASQRLRDVSNQPEIDGLPPEQALERLVREHCQVLLEYPNEIGLLVQQRRFVEPSALGEIVARERAYMGALRSIVTRGVEDGSFRKLDAGIATQLVLDSINGLLRWYRRGGRLPPQQAVDEVWAYIRGGLCAARPARRRQGGA